MYLPIGEERESMTDNEMLDAIKTLLTPINLKLEKMDNRLDNLEREIADVKHEIANNKAEISNLRMEMNRGFRKNNDEIQTLVAVLHAKDIMPKEAETEIFTIAK